MIELNNHCLGDTMCIKNRSILNSTSGREILESSFNLSNHRLGHGNALIMYSIYIPVSKMTLNQRKNYDVLVG